MVVIRVSFENRFYFFNRTMGFVDLNNATSFDNDTDASVERLAIDKLFPTCQPHCGHVVERNGTFYFNE